jgi:hypothetical protein
VPSGIDLTYSGNATNQSAGDIFGARIDAQGNLVDPVPFAVHAGLGEQRYPVVAWNGESWLVAFRSQDPVGGYFANRIRAVRVSPQGEVLDETPLLIASSDLPFRLAGQGGQWMITYSMYHDDGYGTHLAGRRIGGDGAFIDAEPLVLLDWSYGASTLLAAAGEYLVAGADWYDSSVTRAQRIGLDGLPQGDEFTVPGLAIASDGSEYYVAWFSNFVNLVGSRMTAAGVLLTPTGTLLTSDYSQYHSCSVAHDGTQWWIEWGAASAYRTIRVAANGTVLDPGGGAALPLGGTGFAYGPQMSPRDGGGVNFYWNDSRSGDTNVWCIPVNPDNTMEPERCVSTGTATQLLPDLAVGPAGQVAVAFTSGFAADDRVLVHFLDVAGNAMTSEPIEVARGPNLGQAGIAWNGALYLVVWDEGAAGLTTTQIKARRMNADGTFLDAASFDVMAGFSPDVEALGDDFLVGASRFVTFQTIAAIARRVDGPTALLLDPSPLALLMGYVSTGPRVRADGTQWIVTYHSHWSHDSAQSDAVYNFVNANGTFTPPTNPTTTSGGAGTPDVAFSGSRYLFVWRSNTLGSANNSISGRVMNVDGTFATGTFVVAEAAGRQLRPVVDWNGSEFVVAWDDQRNRQAFFDERTDIYAARVSETGSVLDPAGIALVTNEDGDVTAAVRSSAPRVALVASARFSLAAPYDYHRVGITTIGDAGGLPGDVDGDGAVDFGDLLTVLSEWGSVAGCPPSIPADVDGDCDVDFADLLVVLSSWTA